ncbi:MAG: hypothetical protein HYX60_06355 [Legionella longbeachae]|nr:hypothetical protein [Legionella longbeachae]
MTFIPPAFIKFRVNTLNLNTKYSTLIGRYKVIDNSVNNVSSLEVLIARTNPVIKCKTDRETQREVFNLLINELRQIPKEDEGKIEQGTLFLLGALIHRYFRLIKEYEEYNRYASWTIVAKCDVADCKLFQAIREALKFKDKDVVKKKFKEEDLKVLDVVTIISGLEVFRDNMFMEVEEKTPRYMKYPHFAKDKHFKKYLEDIIGEHKKRGSPVLHRFKAIAFLQSLTREIEKEQQQIEKDLQKWCKAVEKEYKTFPTFSELEENSINTSITKSVESETSRNIIFGTFYTPLIQDNLETTDHQSFFTKMKKCYDDTCSYMLFGGYVLLLLQSQVLDRDLLFSLQQALGVEGSLNELTVEDKLNGIKFLKQFIENESGAVLDFDFFGSKEKMHTAIASAEKELTLQLAEKTVETPLVLTNY